MMSVERDIKFMDEAFMLAKKGQGFTSPNPMVGAVITKNNKVIARGYHKKSGLAHAEIEAIHAAKADLKGSVLYVNMEPCCHFGKTPPCVDEIIKNKINRVVISVADPNKSVCGKSIRKLKKAGIKVDLGLCKKEAVRLNEIFFKNMKEDKPFVVGKAAQSLDGKIATHKGESKWITSIKSRNYAKALRDKYDCVLIGANTFIEDDPGLNGFKTAPFKAVISLKLNLPLAHKIFKKNPDKLIIFTSIKNKPKKIKLPTGVRVFFLRESKDGLPETKILKILYGLGLKSIFVEGGSDTLGRFFAKKLIDKIYLFIAPIIIGGKSALSSIGSKGFNNLKDCPKIESFKVESLGKDLLISGYPCYG